MHNDYELLDSGDGRKLERFGDVTLVRPCGQAAWEPQKPGIWADADAVFDRDGGWYTNGDGEMPGSWNVMIDGVALKLELTPAGHLGVFPETRALWATITDSLRETGRASVNVLNLFAYTGGATLAAARAGCSVCHVDSSRSVVTRARENAALNGLEDAPIRWIVEDVDTFLDREIRRGRRYDAIMLDPPTFGRGTKGEQYRFDRDIAGTLGRCRMLLTEEPRFVLLTAHTQGMTARRLEDLMSREFDSGVLESGEMLLTGASGVREVGDGVWARWARSK